MSTHAPQEGSVFLNIPYDASYQPLFVSLVSTLIHLGQQPHCVLEIPETGQGRLQRIAKLLESCSLSIHDLSRQGVPTRMNMPFELGLAWAIRLRDPQHEVVLMDSRPHRLDKVLSDLKGHDALIHNGSCDVLINEILGITQDPIPTIRELREEARVLRQLARSIADSHGTGTIFKAAPFRSLLAAAVHQAVESGHINP